MIFDLVPMIASSERDANYTLPGSFCAGPIKVPLRSNEYSRLSSMLCSPPGLPKISCVDKRTDSRLF
eukprot:scaffold492_cov257-Pinguiococcus_pyrenoidosus.AAC.27